MKVVHISTSAFGGAGIAARRLHEGLSEQGVDSNFLTQGQAGKISNLISVSNRPSNISRVLKRFGFPIAVEHRNAAKIKRGGDYEIFTFPTSSIDLSVHPLVQSADIIHLHWVANFLDYPSFFKNMDKPIVWTLHDMNPFQGGFHYSGDLERNTNTYLGKLDRQLQKQKKQAIQGSKNIHIVSPSRWLMQASQQSDMLSKFAHHHIPYGLDTSLFKPYDAEIARSLFQLPQHKRLLLFVSDHISNKRKGFDLLVDALNQLNFPDDVMLCAVGHLDNNILPDKIIHLGYVSDERLMPLLYSAVDAVIIPSREDNLPNVMLEALACGTPVIGFPIGGIREILEIGSNGILSDEVSADSLAHAILTFLRGDLYDSIAIRNFALQHFDLKKQTDDVLALYRTLNG
jgi:glycosyltransferase involved in cell wall biosynthesis